MKLYCCITIALLSIASLAMAQKPEHQVSFARETKPQSYYIEQAGLWWKEVEKNDTSEDNWYNYFRACRNAQGTGDWKTDFVSKAPWLKPGPDIVALMKQHIPNSFMYNYLSYLDGGIGTDNGDKIMKAYAMNPHFEGIHSSVISYAVSSLDTALRKKVNREWYPANYLSPQLLLFSYNMLMSLDKNAVLITHNDNDTYPLWMLQDALGIRTDVDVVNVDFMILRNYRDHYLKLMSVKPLDIPDTAIDINRYGDNWSKIMHHILANYSFKRPLYIGLNTNPYLYEGYEKKLEVSGLALKFTREKEQLAAFNQQLYEHVFLLDQLRRPILTDANQQSLNMHNLAYLNMLKDVYDRYQKDVHHKAQAAEVKNMAIGIAANAGNEDYIKAVKAGF